MQRFLGFIFLLALFLFGTGFDAVSPAMVLPPGFVSDPVVTGLPASTAVTFTAHGKMFVSQKDGVVRVVLNATSSNPVLLPEAFIDLSDEVNDYSGRGLLGIALHPDFPSVPYVYLLYTYDPPELPEAKRDQIGARVSRLLRVTADASQDYNVAVPGSGVILLGTNSTYANIGDEDHENNLAKASCNTGGNTSGMPIRDCLPSDVHTHTIGTVIFGSDGSLYVGNGDGSANIVDLRALRVQDLDSLSGKIMRINPDTGQGYADNPFYDGDLDSNRSKVVDYGMRNPYRFTLGRKTGEPFIGDVGRSDWEEVDAGFGKNFGWPCYEGSDTGSLIQPLYASDPSTHDACAQLYALGLNAVQQPLYAYDHSLGHASIQADTFYNGSVYPQEYEGALFIADFNRNWIKYLTFDPVGNATVHDFGDVISSNDGGPVDIAAGPDTNLYYVTIDGLGMSEVSRIHYTGGANSSPVAIANAVPAYGSTPLRVQFSAAGSYDPDVQDLTYAWNFGNGITSTETNPVYTYTVPGVYQARLSVTDPLGASSIYTLKIIAGDNAPQAKIIKPQVGRTYRVGSTIQFSGSGKDLEDGDLGGSSLIWEVRLHRDGQTYNWQTHRDIPPPFSGTSGSFVVQDYGDHSWLEICLTVTDSGGLTDQACRTLLPETVTLTFASDPNGYQLVYDDILNTTPFTITTIVNSQHNILAAGVQSLMSFSEWSDGGAPSHTITAPAAPETITATYVNHDPEAIILADPMTGIAPVTVAFTSTTSFDPEGGALTYLWDYGNGVTSTMTDCLYTYDYTGVYTATLTVTDPLGGSGQASVRIDLQNHAPVALISAAPVSGFVPLTVVFTGTASYDPEGAPITYRWDFGEGSTSSEANPVHRYTKPGVYTVKLVVQDVEGMLGQDEIDISVGYTLWLPLLNR
jgi:PKD repeat protein